MKFFNTLLILLFSVSIIFAQQHRNCGHDHYVSSMEEENPGFLDLIEQSFADFQKTKGTQKRSQLITVPIHVIIIHSPGEAVGSGNNLSLAHVVSQIDAMNADFGRYNSDAGNTPGVFPAADTGIQFCLATVDPNGLPTDGITRYATNDDFSSNAFSIRQQTAWDRDFYINVWVAPNLTSGGDPILGVASLATPNFIPSPQNDFIHVGTPYFGGPGFATGAPYNLGRTLTHEMGHHLGLRHVWGSGNGSCTQDDGIDDTPNQSGSNFGCLNHPSPSCGNSGDMFMNYMDYVDDNCMNAFTVEQGQYMNQVLNTTRSSLLGSSATACSTVDPLAVSITSFQNPTCAGGTDGFIVAEAFGGTPPYTYSIDNGAPTTNNVFTDLPAGNYVITVFDSNNETDDTNLNLLDPSPITASIQFISETSCVGDSSGEIQILAQGGTQPYFFTLNGGAAQSESIFSDLTGGTYSYTIEDLNGCMFDSTFTLAASDSIAIDVLATTDLTCGNDLTGTISVVASGGSGMLQYSLDTFNLQDTGFFEMLDGGQYTVVAIDSVGCINGVTVDLQEPEPFFLSVASVNNACHGDTTGSVDLTGNGGNGGPYTFSFDGVTYGDTSMLNNLGAGSYEVFARDSLGCEAIVQFNIQEADSIVLAIDNQMNASCATVENGSLEVSATGGAGVFIYELNTGVFSNSGTFSDLGLGVYSVTAIDSNGCTSVSETIAIEQAFRVNSTGTTDISCFGANDGSFDFDVVGSTGVVTVTLGNETIESSPITDLGPGVYTLEIEEDNGCMDMVTFEIVEPEELLITSTDVVDGEIIVTAIGGTEPYQYVLEGDTFRMTNVLPIEGDGTYTISVIDAFDCSTTVTVVVSDVAEIGELDFDVFPNPFTDKLLISNKGANQVAVTVYDMKGQILLAPTKEHRSQINTENWPAGVYLIKLTNGAEQVVRRCVKF